MRILGASDILSSASGRLVASDAQVDRTLREVFTAAGQGDAALGVKGIAVPLIGRDGERYVAHALPLTSGARRRAGVVYTAAAALFVRKAALAVSSASQAIGSTFKLTPTELRVLLAIVEVGGIPEVATAFGVADTTIRTHVSRLFEKTGTTRQADLVKLVAGYATPLATERDRVSSSGGSAQRRDADDPMSASDIRRTTPERQLFRIAIVRSTRRGNAGDPAFAVRFKSSTGQRAMSIEVIPGKASATKLQAANGDSLLCGNLRVRRDGNPDDEHLSTLAADNRGRSARLQRGRHVEHNGLSGDLCRRTIDCRSVVGPAGATKAELIGPCIFLLGTMWCAFAGDLPGPADRPVDTSRRRMYVCRALPRHCPGSVRWPGAGEDNGVDYDRNRGGPGVLTALGQRA